MSVITAPDITASGLTLQDLTDRLGPMPLSRIYFNLPPGTATEEDFFELLKHGNKLIELVDGMIMEKPMGLPESMLAMAIATFIRVWVAPRKLGSVTGADGMMRLAPGLVRYPDVSFMKASRFPNGRVQRIQVP